MDKHGIMLILKVAEVVFALFYLCLYTAALEKDARYLIGRTAASYVSMFAFPWITAILLLGIVLKKPVDEVVNILVCVLCAAWMIGGGSVLVEDFKNEFPGLQSSIRELNLSAGSFGLITAIVFIVDAVLDYLDA
ncbi:uncharacterized protein [Periplaneta americana]|uniref:uncharacterized protein n=1 Tax=Periplaneta americana TaxID=6978 RepID=UPI0037E79E8F